MRVGINAQQCSILVVLASANGSEHREGDLSGKGGLILDSATASIDMG